MLRCQDLPESCPESSQLVELSCLDVHAWTFLSTPCITIVTYGVMITWCVYLLLKFSLTDVPYSDSCNLHFNPVKVSKSRVQRHMKRTIILIFLEKIVQTALCSPRNPGSATQRGSVLLTSNGFCKSYIFLAFRNSSLRGSTRMSPKAKIHTHLFPFLLDQGNQSKLNRRMELHAGDTGWRAIHCKKHCVVHRLKWRA